MTRSQLCASQGRTFQTGELATKVLGGQEAQQGHCGWNMKNEVGRCTGPGIEDKLKSLWRVLSRGGAWSHLSDRDEVDTVPNL